MKAEMICQTLSYCTSFYFSDNARKHNLTLFQASINALAQDKKKKGKVILQPLSVPGAALQLGKETTLSSVLERCFPIHCLGPPPNVHTLSLSPAFLRNSNRKVFVAQQLGL